MTSLFHRINQEFNNVPICFTRRNLGKPGGPVARGRKFRVINHQHLHLHTHAHKTRHQYSKDWHENNGKDYHRTITTGCSIEIYILSFHPERCHDATIHIISRDSSREKELVLSRTIENRFVFSVRAFYLKTKRKMQNDACRTNPLRNESSSRREIRS